MRLCFARSCLRVWHSGLELEGLEDLEDLEDLLHLVQMGLMDLVDLVGLVGQVVPLPLMIQEDLDHL